MPEIVHINKDGYLPDIHVENQGNTSSISYSLCQKPPEEGADIPQIIDGVSFPLSLISMEQVRLYMNIHAREIKTLPCFNGK